MITVQPSSSFEATAQFDTALAGTLGVRITDNAGNTTTARVTAGIAEYPAGSGIYAVTLTAPATAGQYTLVWDDGAGGDWAIDDLLVTTVIAVSGISGDAYATVDELARVLKIRSPSSEETEAMTRVLVTAAGEINSEIDLADDDPDLTGWQLALAAEVNLERAVEHWQQGSVAFGIIGLGDGAVAYTARDSWDRHAHKLAPLKSQWGIA